MHKIFLTTFVIGSLALNALTAFSQNERITVAVHGKGPDVVLIPGLACSAAVWDPTVKQLEGHYRLHVVQVAGFAGAAPRANVKGPILQPTVGAVDAYIKSNHLAKPFIIGHSMGGVMGMMLALQHPGEVGKLMIVDSLPFFSLLMGAQDVASAEPQAAMMRDLILSQTQEAYALGEKQLLPTLVKSPDGLKSATQWGLASDKSVVARAMYELMTTDLRPKLREIKTPVTMLYPWDPASPFSHSETTHFYEDNFSSLPNKKLICITNSFHMIMLDQPQAFAKQVNAFLK